MVQLSHPCMTTGKTIALTRQTFVDLSLLFNMVYRLVITFLPRSKHLLISRLQSWLSICQQIWKTPQWPQEWKSQFSFQSLRKAMPKKAQTTTQLHSSHMLADFPGGSDGKASAYKAGDMGSVPGLGRFPAEGNGNPLQYSCLENPTDGEAW